MKYQSRILICLLLTSLSLLLLLPRWAGAQTADTNKCPIPEVDVLGEDIAGFPRYPNSVRVRFARETERNIIALNQKAKGMEITYRSNDGMRKIMEFYNSQLTESGWELFSSNYMGESSVQMVFSQDKKSLMFSLRPYTAGFAPGRRITASGERPPPAPSGPTNCYLIQVFSWHESASTPLEWRTRSSDNQSQPSRRPGR